MTAPDSCTLDQTDAATIVKDKQETKKKRQPPYNVILVDDNDHTYDYVIRMLGSVFGYDHPRSFKMACEVDQAGRVILLTTSRERAELKQEQIHAFGPDPLIPHCKGSMTAVLEPAADV